MKNTVKNKYRKINIYILMALTFIIPLIVRIHFYDLSESLYPYYKNLSRVDLFAFYKVQVLIVIGLLLFVSALFFRFYYEKKYKINVFIGLLMAFILSILVSYLFSEHKDIAWQGMVDRFEGTKTWIVYVMLAFVAYTFVKEESDAYKIITSFVLSSGVVSIIGMFQMLHMDLFKSELGKKLILGSLYEQYKDQLNFNFADGLVYSTLYNPNYIGSMIVLSFPLTIYCIVKTKKNWLRSIFFLLSIFQLVALAGSQSTGGVVAVAIEIVLISIYIFVKALKNKKLIIGLVMFLSLIVVGATQTNLFKNQYEDFIKNMTLDSSQDFAFEEVSYKDDVLSIYLGDGSGIDLWVEKDVLMVKDHDGREIILTESNENIIRIIEENKYNLYITHNRIKGLITIRSTNKVDGLHSFIQLNLYFENHLSMGQTLLTEENVETSVFPLFENEYIFSNRGYIWNRTLAVISENPIIGYGADTFMINFPQTDVLNKYNILRNPGIIVDKAHNFYLQNLINFGLLGTGIFISLIIISILRNKTILLIIALIGFSVVGLINDSIVAITFFVFILIGMMVKIGKENNNERS